MTPSAVEKLSVRSKAIALSNGSRQIAVIGDDHTTGKSHQARDIFRLPGLLIRQVGEKLAATLSGTAIEAAAEPSSRRELIDRLFSFGALQSARIHWKKGEIRLEFEAAKISPEEIISGLARAMSGPRPATSPLPHEVAVLGDDAPASFSIVRADAGLTLWQIDTPSSHFFRIAHPLLRLDYVRKQVLDELTTLSDVVLRSIYLPLAGSEALLVFGRPHRIDPALFREVLDPVLTRCLAAGPSRPAPSIRDRLINANLALAAVTDFLFPPLGIANIALTGTLGAGYVPRALLALRQKKVTLELLYLVIASLTIITYEFLPAALMYWLMRYWPRRGRQLYDSHYSRFLARYRLRPRRVWVDRAGTSVETRIEELPAASMVTLTAGDVVPGDGVIVEGDARLDEGVLTGAEEPVAKVKGSAIYAASRVVEGSVRIKINALGEETAVGRLARWHESAHVHDISESVAHESAERTVLPVLLVSGLAALQGGLATAKAVIRPDYATGPAVAENLGRLASVIRAANDGILITGSPALEKLAGPVSLVFDDSVAWRTPQLQGKTFSDLAQSLGIEEAVFFSARGAAAAARLATGLGFAAFHDGSSAEVKHAFIAGRQKEGRTVIYVGDCHAERRAAAQADLAIAVTEPPFHRLHKSATTLLSPDLLKVLRLRAIALDATEDLNTAFSISMVPNVAAIVAGFLFASPVYLSVLLTNVGTFANYVRSEAILQLSAHSRVRT